MELVDKLGVKKTIVKLLNTRKIIELTVYKLVKLDWAEYFINLKI